MAGFWCFFLSPFLGTDLCFPAHNASQYLQWKCWRSRARVWAAGPRAVCFISPCGAVGLPFITHLSSSDGRSAGFSCHCSDTHGFMDVTASSEERGFIDHQLCGGPGLRVPLTRRRLGLPGVEGKLTACVLARQGSEGAAADTRRDPSSRGFWPLAGGRGWPIGVMRGLLMVCRAQLCARGAGAPGWPAGGRCR